MGRAGKALKQVLAVYDISQYQLAATMEIDRSNISRWVSEERDPSAEAVFAIKKGSWQLLVIYILRQKAEGRWQKGGRRKHEKKRDFGVLPSLNLLPSAFCLLPYPTRITKIRQEP